MDRLLYTAMTGASATLGQQAAVAHNLANVASTGYRAEEHRLRAVQVQTRNPGEGTLPTRAFVVDASTHTDMSPGPMNYTGRAFDVAVQGSGWIALAMPDGTEAYTRNGSLELNVNGVLQTRDGIPVQGDGGPITVPPDNKVSIAADGTVSIVPESGAQNTSNNIGRIKLVNPAGRDLVRGGDGMFRMRDGTAAPLDETTRLASGFLEGSNVNPVSQMVAMISLSRQFDMQMQMITNAQANDRSAEQLLQNF
ncbi:MAG TPA: flagellar basal-body rod protein FlgF [Rhodocyclaceae bacterium]